MSLKYTYHKILSIALTLVIAWNSFGYIGFFLGSNIFEILHASEKHHEVTFCKMKHGKEECTCNHEQDSMHHDQRNMMHCITDLELNPPLDEEILISWDTRNYILDNSSPATLLNNIELEWLPGSDSFADEYVTKLLRPPTLV